MYSIEYRINVHCICFIVSRNVPNLQVEQMCQRGRLLDMNHDSPTDNDHDMDYHCDFMGELVHIVLAHLLQLLILKYVNCVV